MSVCVVCKFQLKLFAFMQGAQFLWIVVNYNMKIFETIFVINAARRKVLWNFSLQGKK